MFQYVIDILLLSKPNLKSLNILTVVWFFLLIELSCLGEGRREQWLVQTAETPKKKGVSNVKRETA